MVSLLKILRVYEFSIFSLCTIICMSPLLLMLGRSGNSAATFLMPMLSFLLALTIMCMATWRSAADVYIVTTPFLQRKILNFVKFIFFGVLCWVIILVSIVNIQSVGIIGVCWLCACLIYYIFQYHLYDYMVPICISVAVLSIWFCGWLAATNSLTSSMHNSLLTCVISVGLGFLLLYKTKKSVILRPRSKGLFYWLCEFNPSYNRGKSIGVGFYTPNWIAKLYFPHSFMLSGMLASYIFNATIIAIFVWLELSHPKYVTITLLFYMCVAACPSAFFDRAGKGDIKAVDFQMLSLMPSFDNRIDFVNKLLLSFIQYIFLYVIFVLALFSLVHGEIPKFSALQWSICILAPLSVGSLSFLFFVTSRYRQKWKFLALQVMGYLVLALLTYLKFSSAFDVLLISAYLVVQVVANFYMGRKELLDRSWV